MAAPRPPACSPGRPAQACASTARPHAAARRRAGGKGRLQAACRAAQVSRHNARRESYGHALAVDPWGAVVGEVTEPAEGICVVRVDRARLRNVRQTMPVAAHRRQGRASLGWG